MATYLELHALRGASATDPLKQKIAVAIAIKANSIAKLPTPTAEQKAWAVSALADPNRDVGTVLAYILAEYNAQATSAITGASDANVQAAVNAAVDTLLGA
jgi:hypothetical protein